MCGICGIIDLAGALSPSCIEKMITSLAHRGPDGQDSMHIGGAWLGHTRLSIIDLSTGEQPMSDSTGRWWIVFNGEIYNYREIRKVLEEKGCCFQTSSDTEVILQAYIFFGEDALAHLNGQFAFAIWDNQKQVFFAARDRLGEKPFYFAISDRGQFIFASEIKSILASGLIQPKLDRSALNDYLMLLYIPPQKTIFGNIQTLAPGHALRWNNGQVEQYCYWHLTFGRYSTIDSNEAVSEVRRLISQAVQRQMVSDVPIGAFLSGGLDSSTIVALMSQFSDQPVKTFSVGFGKIINELPYANAVARKYRTEHHEIQMNISVADMLEKMTGIYDEPFADSSNIPTYAISQFARQHVKVVLSGDGGDEVFGGYPWYLDLLADEQQKVSGQNNLLLANTKYALMKIMSKIHLIGVEQLSQAGRVRNSIRNRRQDSDVFKRNVLRRTCFSLQARLFLWGQPIYSTEFLNDENQPESEITGLDKVIHYDFRCYLPGDILVKVDRAAMATGLEVRAPFLDFELVEFVLSLPVSLRLKNGRSKYLLHESCGDLWPSEIRRLSKQGFGGPVNSWVDDTGIKRIAHRLLQKGSSLVEVLPGVNSFFPKASSQQKWTLLCLGLWLEKNSASV